MNNNKGEDPSAYASDPAMNKVNGLQYLKNQ
jgi:hypothetical protein